MWQRLTSKTILKHPRLVVVEDEVKLPSGHKTNYLRFENGGNYPTVIAFNDHYQILVLKEYSYPPNEWLYQFPGGFVPENEDLEQGINRELMEETNLKAKKLKLLGSFYPTSRRSNSQTYVFMAQDLVGEKKKGDIEEEIQLFWLTEQEIDDLIKTNDFKNGSSLGAWAIYKSSKLV